MSAPDTNLERQKTRHAGPLIGFGAVIVFAGICLFAYLTLIAQPTGEGEADVVASPEVSTTTN